MVLKIPAGRHFDDGFHQIITVEISGEKRRPPLSVADYGSADIYEVGIFVPLMLCSNRGIQLVCGIPPGKTTRTHGSVRCWFAAFIRAAYAVYAFGVCCNH